MEDIFMFNSFETAFPIIVMMSILTSIIVCVIIVNPLKDMIKQQSFIIHQLLRQVKILNDHIDNMNDDINNNFVRITSLFSSIQKANNKKHQPTVDEIKLIEVVITDTITTEANLARNQTIKSDHMKEIITKVCDTFPDVDIEYIARKTISMIETFANRMK